MNMSDAYTGKEAEIYNELVGKYFDYENEAEKLHGIVSTFSLLNLFQKMKTGTTNEFKEPKTILELGVGTGLMAEQMIKQGYRVLGIDTSQDMLDIARENFEKKYSKSDNFWKNICLYKANSEEFNLEKDFPGWTKNNKVDLIYSHSGPITLMVPSMTVRVDSQESLDKIARRISENLEDEGLFFINLERPEEYEMKTENNEVFGLKINQLDTTKEFVYKRTHFYKKNGEIVHERYIESKLLTSIEYSDTLREHNLIVPKIFIEIDGHFVNWNGALKVK